MKASPTLYWDEEKRAIVLVDQTKLPSSYRYVNAGTVDRLVKAISRLEVRGAPALGIAGAYGTVLAADAVREEEFGPYLERVTALADRIRSARPTAINLSWGVDRVLGSMRSKRSVEEARTAAKTEADRIAAQDAADCHSLGEYGATLLPDRCTVLTHCNAGALACSEWGTALGVIRSAVAAGKQVKVFACETRPLLQGARLTAWELVRDGIDVTVIPDSAAAHFMRQGKVDCVIVGADRITRDAVFNKIGTYMHAVCANQHNIPFFVAAPLSTFDPDLTEEDVEIEERGGDELAYCGIRRVIPEGAGIANPAFDATPLSLVNALITEQGIMTPPYEGEMSSRSRRNK